MRKLIGIFSVLSLLSISAALPAETRDPYQHFFHETWGDFQEELDNAREQGKKGILIFFEMDECPFCHYMKENVLNRPEVQEYYREHFLNFPVDIEGDVEITNMQGEQKRQKDFVFREHRVRATPVFAFFNLDGERVHRYTGKTSGVEEFMWMGEYVAEGIYKDTSFIRYKRDKRKK